MTNQFKNPVFWSFILFLGGILVAVIGYLKNESTIATATKGSVFLMVLGGFMFVAGVIGMFSYWKR